MILISPSLLSADFGALGADAQRMEKAGADWLHYDVMDGHFVPNISIGIPVLKSLKSYTSVPLDVHLMISEPLKYIADFAKAGADIITFHIESDSDPVETIKAIRDEITKRGLDVMVEVDGGISEKNAALCAENGIDVLVSGSTIFGASDATEMIALIRKNAEAAFRA